VLGQKYPNCISRDHYFINPFSEAIVDSVRGQAKENIGDNNGNEYRNGKENQFP
jgi:hypothetical protein